MFGYNFETFTINKCLIKDKENMNLEDFKNSFYRRLKLNGKQYTDKQYDSLLEALYQSSEQDYRECYKKMSKMDLKYFRDYQDILATLINSNNINLIDVARDMYKKRGSMVSRILPIRVNQATIKDTDKLLLTNLQQLLLDLKDEDNDILKNAKEEFAKFYGEYSNNQYLSSYYQDMINNFEEELIRHINERIDKIPGVKNILNNDKLNNISKVYKR